MKLYLLMTGGVLMKRKYVKSTKDLEYNYINNI